MTLAGIILFIRIGKVRQENETPVAAITLSGLVQEQHSLKFEFDARNAT